MKMFYSKFIQVLAVFAILSGSFSIYGQSTNKTVTIRGEVVNGSNGKLVSGIKVNLFNVEKGLDLISSQKDAGPRFIFKDIPSPKGPMLIAVEFNGESYFRMLHPADTNFNLPHRIFVFDTGAKAGMVRLTSMHQVTKTHSGLKIEKLFIVVNGSNPAFSFDTSNLRFHLPENATNVASYMRLETTNISLPVNIVKKDDSTYAIDHAFRPGNATLSITYNIPGYSYEEQMPDISSTDDQLPMIHNFLVVGWKPLDARPEIEGAQIEDMTVPGMGKAIKVAYEPGAKIEYDFSSGSALVENLLESHFNPVFSSWLLTIIGLVLFAGVMMILIPALASTTLAKDILNSMK